VNAGDLEGVDLLILGSPTYGSMPTDAAQSFLNRMGPPACEGARAATFDTRLTWGFLRRWGFAADKMADALTAKGWTVVVEPGGFFVRGLKKGPLKKGEADRAAAWAKGIVEDQEQSRTWRSNRREMIPQGENASQPVLDPIADAQLEDDRWIWLYRFGAVAALLAVVLFRRNFGTELVAFRGFGIFDVPAALPVAAVDWFVLLQDNRLVGLLLLNVVDVVNYALVGLLFLAVQAALRRVNRSVMAIATACTLVGVGVYFVSNQAINVLTLSDRYAAATSETLRSMFVAAGEALLAIDNPGTIYQGTGSNISLALVLLAGLMISIVMLRSSVFSRATAIIGITFNGVALLHFIEVAFAPTVCGIPSIISAPFRVVWYVLVALRLFRLAAAGRHAA